MRLLTLLQAVINPLLAVCSSEALDIEGQGRELRDGDTREIYVDTRQGLSDASFKLYGNRLLSMVSWSTTEQDGLSQHFLLLHSH